MPVLLLRLKAPMMSWGHDSQFTIRRTGTEPTKSAITGLLCAALGRPREASTADLAALRMGVRIDDEGVVLQDYHTIQNAIRSSGAANHDGVISIRHYVADANYLVGLEGDHTLLEALDAALAAPVWPIYFGRKSFVPSRPVRVGLREDPLVEALEAEPITRTVDHVRGVIETPDGNDLRQDVPIDWLSRRFGTRAVETRLLKVKKEALP